MLDEVQKVLTRGSVRGLWCPRGLVALSWGENLPPISPCSGAPGLPTASPVNPGGSVSGTNFPLGPRGGGTQNRCFASLHVNDVLFCKVWSLRPDVLCIPVNEHFPNGEASRPLTLSPLFQGRGGSHRLPG